jgi:cell division septal protein FtsQ
VSSREGYHGRRDPGAGAGRGSARRGRPVLSPRAGGGTLTDVGAPPSVIARQRIDRAAGRARRGGGGGRRQWRALVALGALGAVLLAAGGAAGHWLLTAPGFGVGAVEIQGASRVPVADVLAAAAIPAGANLWRIDAAGVTGRVTALPGVRRAEIVRELPNRVTIRVEERQPFTLLHGGRLHWLDEEGYVVGEAPAVAPPVPVISGLTPGELESLPGEPAPRVLAAIGLVRMLIRSGSTLAQAISEIDMSRRDGPVLYTVDGIEVRLGTEDWEERLVRLEGVLARVASEAVGVRGIDLRFRHQVVLTKGGQG